MNRKSIMEGRIPRAFIIAVDFMFLGGMNLVWAENPTDSVQSQAEIEVDGQTLTAYESALFFYKTGHYDDARKYVDAAEKEKPGDLPTEILKARILTEQGDFTGGEQVLRPLLTPNGPLEVQLAMGDLFLRKRDFSRAADLYTAALKQKAEDPDIMLKLIYAKIGISDLVSAEKLASQLKPFDPDHPSYYFAKAALAQATGKEQEGEEDIQTARTIYGITVTNRYLKTYLEVFSSSGEKAPATAPSTTAPPASPKL